MSYVFVTGAKKIKFPFKSERMTDISNMEDIAVLKADIDAKLQKVNASNSDDAKWFSCIV